MHSVTQIPGTPHQLLTLRMDEQAQLNYELALYLLAGIKDYAIFMIKPNGIIGTWNPGVQRLLGYSEMEFIGMPFHLIFTDEDIKASAPQFELITADKTGRAEDQRWHRKKDGSVFWANGLVTLMKDEAGEFKGYAKIMRDQTAQKQFVEEIKRKNTSLEVANRELTNFASVVSHDLNAPLQTMQGFANLLRGQEGLGEEVEQSINYILESTERMSSMVNDLLRDAQAVEKIDRFENVDTSSVIGETVRSLSAAINSTNTRISCRNLPQVWADRTMLGRVFQNLIENAIKYASEGRDPEILISATMENGDAHFMVKDNGRGIPSMELERVFTMFERVNPNESIPGRGIGLATCRKIIERFGGQMWAESELGNGTTLHFTIPLTAEKAKADVLSNSCFAN